MSEEIKPSFSLYYCISCGWSITNEEVQKITGIREKISYCQGCGKKLIRLIDENLSNKKHENNLSIPNNQKNNFMQQLSLRNQYSDELLEICKLLYEKIGSFRGIKRELKMQGIKMDRKTVKKELEKRLKKEGKNFDKWGKNIRDITRLNNIRILKLGFGKNYMRKLAVFQK